MPDELRILLSLSPWVPIIFLWHRGYRVKTLRVRLMAASAALGAFLSLSIHALMISADAEVLSLGLSGWLANAAIGTAFGLTFLAWWLILKGGLTRLGIRW